MLNKYSVETFDNSVKLLAPEIFEFDYKSIESDEDRAELAVHVSQKRKLLSSKEKQALTFEEKNAYNVIKIAHLELKRSGKITFGDKTL